MAGFGDVRVAERADWFVDQIAVTGSLVLKHVGGGRAGEVAANRLLSSPHCSIEAVIDTFSARTAGACAGREIVCAQDTSEINFKGRAAARKGLGPGGDGVSPGFFIHPLVAIDVKDGALLGIGGAHIWTRPEGKAGSRYKRGPDDKESARWLEGARRAGQVFAGAARVTVVADRESDIFHLFARRPENADLIVRAAQDRALEDRALEDRALEDRALEGGGRLFAALALEDAVETRMVKIAPRGPGDRGRVAKVELRARRVRRGRSWTSIACAGGSRKCSAR